MRGLSLAFGFLTRLPMPALADDRAEELGRSAVWFPVVGMVIGLLLWAAARVGLTVVGTHADAWLGAWLAVLAWMLVTGGLHLDGAADLADALGAAHRDPARFQDVLKDPHIGSFGVMALVGVVLTKLVAAHALLAADAGALWPWLLIPAWARASSVLWSQTLPTLAAGLGERFAWQVSGAATAAWMAALTLLNWTLVSPAFALAAWAAAGAWWGFLRLRLGGMSGDCLGAGIEHVECALLLAAAWVAA